MPRRRVTPPPPPGPRGPQDVVTTAETSPTDPAQVAAFVERLGSAFTEAGFPRLPARVFSSLLATESGRMTATELVDSLEVSPAAVSGAVNYLAGIHLIHRERERGSRRDVYVVRDDAWHDMMLSTARIYDPFIRALAEGVATVGGESSRAGARLALSVEFLEFISLEVAGIAQRWEARRRGGLDETG
ncbi:MAG: transcriptional regulator TrmB [Lapillicoccus sp.]